MHSFIAAMARRFPIHLAIIVGHPAMIETEPLGGHTVETGLVIASTDPLAADVVGAMLLRFQVQNELPGYCRHVLEALLRPLEDDFAKNDSPYSVDLNQLAILAMRVQSARA